MSKKKNCYVVWNGVNPGVYDNWDDCKEQITGYVGALYKSFPNRAEAEEAFNGSPWEYINRKNEKLPYNTRYNHPDILKDSIAVDAACSGNPGMMEYRGVYVKTGEQIFHQGPFEQGTNNVGEFLALVHGMALLKQKNIQIPIYSDSANAIKWVKEGKCKTKLEKNSSNSNWFDMVERAENWLKNNKTKFQIIKWNTEVWGEIPADFGRK